MYKTLAFASILVASLTGCASSVVNDVNRLNNQLTVSKARQESARQWLASHPTVFVRQSCMEPPRGRRPDFSCTTAGEARNQALAVCAISYKGCDVVVERFKAQLDSADKRFLASQACESKLAELMGEQRSAEDIAVDGVLAVADDRCENGGFFGKTIGCLYSYAGKAAKFVQFVSCVDEKTQRCTANYQNWANGPANAKKSCEQMVAQYHYEDRNSTMIATEITRKKDTWAWKLFGP